MRFDWDEMAKFDCQTFSLNIYPLKLWKNLKECESIILYITLWEVRVYKLKTFNLNKINQSVKDNIILFVCY